MPTPLASGTTVLALPLALSHLADMVGFDRRMGIVGFLLAGVSFITLAAKREVSTG
ncbi:MAG: hypothetical protein HY865_17210 [Chloroflexi bacterium]|nr:hypothetical protein [Chloroflexota bacterium]